MPQDHITLALQELLPAGAGNTNFFIFPDKRL